MASAPMGAFVSCEDSEATSPSVFDTRDKMYERWHRLVAQYSARKLTYESDKLPVISGAAREIALSTHDEYLAGLWKGDLA